MKKASVYLAGPITGLRYKEATTWRNYVRTHLDPGIEAISPLRNKDYLENVGVIGDAYEEMPLSTSRAIMTRDFFDCKNCDVILANLLETKRVSIGTVMEIAWAYNMQKPLVIVAEANNIHNHCMVREATGFRVDNLKDGIKIVNSILSDYIGE